MQVEQLREFGDDRLDRLQFAADDVTDRLQRRLFQLLSECGLPDFESFQKVNRAPTAKGLRSHVPMPVVSESVMMMWATVFVIVMMMAAFVMAA